MPPINSKSLYALADHAEFAYSKHSVPNAPKLRTATIAPVRTPTELPWLEISEPRPDVHVARLDVRHARRAGFRIISVSSKYDVADFLSERPGFAFNGAYFVSKHTFAPLGYTFPMEPINVIPHLYRHLFRSVSVTDDDVGLNISSEAVSYTHLTLPTTPYV